MLFLLWMFPLRQDVPHWRGRTFWHQENPWFVSIICAPLKLFVSPFSTQGSSECHDFGIPRDFFMAAFGKLLGGAVCDFQGDGPASKHGIRRMQQIHATTATTSIKFVFTLVIHN